MAINNALDSKQLLSSNDSPQFSNIKIVSTINGSHPVPSMTTTQQGLISSPNNGDMTFLTDTNPPRLYVYDGDWEGVAYFSEIPIVPSSQSGTYTPTLTAISSFGSLSLISAFYSTINIIAGNICYITASFTGTPSSGTGNIGISIPVGNNFSGTGKALFIGGTAFDTATQAIFSNFRAADSASGNSVTIAITTPVGAVSVSNTYQISIGYIIQ